MVCQGQTAEGNRLTIDIFNLRKVSKSILEYYEILSRLYRSSFTKFTTMKAAQLFALTTFCLFYKISVANTVDTTGKVKVVFFRPFKYVGCAIGYNLHYGDSVITRIRTTAFHEAEFAPGSQRLWAATEKKIYLDLYLTEGKTCFVKCGVGWGILVGRPKFKVLSEREIAKYTKRRFLRKRMQPQVLRS